MAKYQQGIYPLTNPQKYRGDPTKVVFRSSWEFHLMRRFDNSDQVLEWSSEEIQVAYRSPKDNKIHRYFPDFLIKMRNTKGIVETIMIEVKPLKETKPPQIKKKATKGYLNEVVTYGVNQAKWKAADEYCKKRGWTFQVMTELEVFI